MLYVIKINFHTNGEEEVVEYYNGNCSYNESSSDNFLMSNYSITLSCNRKGDRDLEDAINNFNSTFNKQITKVIAYLVGTIGILPEINTIVISKHDKNNEILDEFIAEKVIQPLEGHKLSEELILDKDKMISLLNEDDKSRSLLIATTYWLKGVTADLAGDSFDKLWKSFNTLYSYISKKDHEFDKLVFIKGFIWDKKELFSKSCDIFEDYTKEKIRELRWREMILNDHETKKQTKAFADFIKRYDDYRLNEVFKEILPYRKKFLEEEGLYDEVLNIIEERIQLKQKHNEQILTFYILKYAYFLRNKYFHAEKLDSTFYLIKNNEIKELKSINYIFSTFLKELLEGNSKY
ncbi:hypothetical protein COM60_07120 [Bacillus toyonensis]|uniref:hypothetical protein n=1 Tax=Bacillus toyonensis TaxID=155322 RepID=UPI000BF30100|nr:hypothetical protein [Bacillus toyonensis]PGE40386.1 hypothetical protein COM60_07120 [Bacillus toyonensis]